ncbi:MAG: glyoxalase [Pseudonocardiales bacterium]|nr:MAG: glyoxalase [Pseudonocardiales bacterium]
MTRIESVILEAADPVAAEEFYAAAFGLGELLRVRAGDTPSSGFRGFTLSLVVAQPNIVDELIGAAMYGGASTLKPVTKSFWGYGGVVQAPDGTIWKVASSAKKNSGPATREVEDVVLLLGVADVKATKQFYLGHGLSVAKSFGSKYVEFEAAASPVKLALYSRRAAAKDVGVSVEGTGSHRIVIVGGSEAVTDPDGFAWQASTRTGADRTPSA